MQSELTSDYFPDTQLSISTIGLLKLNLTMVRGTFPSLFLLTEPFNVKPAALNTTESDVRGSYIIGGVLGDVTVVVSLPLKLTPYVLWWGTCGLQLGGAFGSQFILCKLTVMST